MKKRIVVLLVLIGVLAAAGTAWGAADKDSMLSLVSEHDGILTRGEYAAMLVEAAGLEGELSPVDLLVKEGIMKGYPGGELYPEKSISRVEALALAARTLGLSDGITPPEGAIAPLAKDHWAYNLYAWFNRQGLAGGGEAETMSEEEGAILLQNIFSSSEEVLSILEQSQAKTLESEFLSFQTRMSGAMKMIPRAGIEGAAEVPQMTTNMEIVQEMVLPDSLHQTFTIDMDIPGQGPQSFTLESYLAGGKMYQQFPNPETGELQWFRYPDNMLPNLDQMLQQAEQQTEVIPPGLEEFLHYQLLGTTEIDGEKVYEIAFRGKVDDFQKFISAAFNPFGRDNQQLMDSITQASSMLDSMSFWGIEYIGVDDLLPRGAEYSFIITYAEEFQGEKIPIEALEMTIRIEEYSYNPDMVIELPEEVISAPELELPGVE